MGKGRDAWAAGGDGGGFVFGSEEQRRKNEETLDKCLRQLHSRKQQPLEKERYDADLLLSSLSDIRSKLYNSANPPDPIRNSWMKDPIVGSAIALSEGVHARTPDPHNNPAGATKRVWDGGAKLHDWVPESREDKKRWLEKVYCANHTPQIQYPTTRASHVRPASASAAARPASAHQRPVTAGPSRSGAKQHGDNIGGG
eukprot:CAMPEP_0114127218 /NCGR_PEP_ID=MMETSP0043_2-20121206/10251_1 /TAXON_ID=464988 /ORGANISM="Hemiselmis andersenii, Strain CCMP644" /LENGTH=198 /DNA_ID=CAMNT_0001220265 /DNA_START=8 /DNA_END=600 /DNA_ORIENTATION=+